jgi:phage terminase large subunit-like protein
MPAAPPSTSQVRAGLSRIHAIAPTAADVWDVLVEGSSGLMKTCGADPVPRIIRYKRRLEWPNGATGQLFSGEESDQLQGPQAQLCYIDELAKMRYAEDVFDNAMLGLRLGDKPRMLITTTPRPTVFMKKLVKMQDVSITTSSTFANTHLSADFLKRVREQSEGTRRGLQELHGSMLLEPADALFEETWLIHDDVNEGLIEQVTVAVDPSGSKDEVGIVVAALLTDGRYAVLADRSASGTPAQWGDAAVRAHDDFDADDVVVEINFGGQMATDVIKQAADRAYQQDRRSTNMIRIKEVSASRGKVMRAEPVSLLYERNRVLHRHGLEKLDLQPRLGPRHRRLAKQTRRRYLGLVPPLQGRDQHSNRIARRAGLWIAGTTRRPALTRAPGESNLKLAFLNFPAQETRSESEKPPAAHRGRGFRFASHNSDARFTLPMPPGPRQTFRARQMNHPVHASKALRMRDL